MQDTHPIGVFDSGYGGLTVFRSIAEKLPQYDYIYLGDNARAPYGDRSFETIHEYTLECVRWFFKMGCPLVIIACNTASAKALRTIQQQDLPKMDDPTKRVLGVIRPTAEVIGNYTKSGTVGVLGTNGTVNSESYKIEINNFFPDIQVKQLACPMWVPLIENGDYNTPAADYYVKKYLDELMQSPGIDTILLACTHYPLLMDKIKSHLSENITVVAQGEIVASSLAEYLQRHPDMESRLSQNGTRQFYTTDDATDFNRHATTFFGKTVEAGHLNI